jgi:signal transduction histidine kinase
VIRNTGPSAALDPSRIFERFYKQNAHAQSMGLGLAISRKIADLHHFSLDYRFGEGWHTFIIKYPAASAAPARRKPETSI